MRTKHQIQQTIESYGSADATIEAALTLLAVRMRRPGPGMSSPSAVRDYMRLSIAELEYESFWAFSLDAQNRVIAGRELFRGTLTVTSVYPREIVRVALADNAAGMIFAHNHPSGIAEPSHADETMTQALKNALILVDVRVLDHFIIGGSGHYLSFCERGLL